MKRDTTKSEKVPAERRTRVGIQSTREIIPIESPPDEGPWIRAGARDEYLQISQRMDGPLEGLSALVRIDLSEGELMVRDITFTPLAPMPLHEVGTAAMRQLRFGEIMWIVEQCLTDQAREHDLLAERVMPYLQAVRKHKRRPGRRGTPDLMWADIAAKRVEAEKRWPGNALRKMHTEWPELFSSSADASDKVYRAKRKGMIDTGRGRPPRLTDKAIATLGIDQTEGTQS